MKNRIFILVGIAITLLFFVLLMPNQDPTISTQANTATITSSPSAQISEPQTPAANLNKHINISYLEQRHTDDLDKLKERKIIRALVVPGRTDFYINEGEIDGMMVQMLKHYETFLNKGIKKEANKTRIVYIPVNFDELIPSLVAGKGDIAAALLTLTEQRKQQVDFISSESRPVNELIISRKDSDIQPKQLDDLAGQSIYVLKDSSYIEHLHSLSETLTDKGLKAINIIEAEEYLSSEDILEMLNAGAIDLTVIDDFKANLWAKVLPNIEVQNDLIVNQAGAIGWAIRKDSPQLKEHLSAYAKTISKGTYLGNVLFHQFLGRDQKLSNLQLSEERESYRQFIELFKKYGDEYQINYLKLMAQGYQESGLKQDMKSHRGAVGIMQLLPSTAKDKNVNIADIDQVENNIHAGAKYMNFIRERYYDSPDITPENQIFFSWAAYNAGPANVRKMRKLADEMGLDKNVWFQNVEVAAGRIIGTETVRYVANIYKFYSTYLLMEQQEQTNAQLKNN